MLRQSHLSDDERLFVLENWNPICEGDVRSRGAFFTPMDLAWNAAIMAHMANPSRKVDLCAGIGRLSYQYLQQNTDHDITCVEHNWAYVEVGKKCVPEATWICADVLCEDLWERLGRFDMAFSNPPFGRIQYDKEQASWFRYQGVFDLMVAEIAVRVAPIAMLILPTTSTHVDTSSGLASHRMRSGAYDKFMTTHPDLIMDWRSIVPGVWKDEWEGASPMVEVVTLEREYDFAT